MKVKLFFIVKEMNAHSSECPTNDSRVLSFRMEFYLS
jgi:hypothetical protein